MSHGTFSPVGPPTVETSGFAGTRIDSDIEELSDNGTQGRVSFLYDHEEDEEDEDDEDATVPENDIICTGPGPRGGGEEYTLQSLGPIKGAKVVTVEYHPIKLGVVTRGPGRKALGCGPVIFLDNNSMICCTTSSGGPGPLWTTTCGGDDWGEIWEVEGVEEF